MMWRNRVVVATALIGAASGGAQSVHLRNVGSGTGPALLSQALAGPHTLIKPAAASRVLRADSTWPNTVISLGRTVIVEGAVHGDVIVVNADLYVHPGGNIDGRAIA
ncbi:MAG TPA: hypothetical protein VII52_12925, partial [Gemmatimonadaceae bacterium]